MPTCASCGERNPDSAHYCNACGAAISEARAAGSRRLATVLFCDLADSTQLASRLDPESVRTVLSRHLGSIRTVIERHGGTLEKFIGDAAMAVFGVPRVHEDDALRAVRAAIDMRQALVLLNEELERGWGIVLQTRTGIASGEVVTGDATAGHGFVTGGIVNLAARLEQAAPRGAILMTEDTYRLVRDAVTAERVGPLSLKGFDDSIVAYQLGDVTPLAPGHTRRFDSPLVDREREQVMLRQTFDRVVFDRRSQLFTVLGPPGVGKSRLVDEFLREAEDQARVLRGRCLPYGEGITFWPVAEIVEQAVGLTEADSPELARGKLSQLLSDTDQGSVVADRVAEAVGISAGAAAPEETLWAIRLFFESMAAQRPLVLLFDDIHWAEPTFLELIEHVAELSRDAPIMLLCLARPELLEVRPAWGGGKMNVTTILLDPLRPEDTNALVLNLLGGAEVAPDILERIVETAGGFPLFAEEMVSVLIDEGVLVREGERWVAARDMAEFSLPQTITGLLSARLDRLTPGELSVIERASVIGRDFYATELNGLAPTEHRSQVDEDLRSLVRKELLRPAQSKRPGEEAYRFRHLLIRDAAYNAMPKSTRAELHEQFATWLEDRAGRRLEEFQEIVAYHLQEAHTLHREVGPLGPHLDVLAGRAGAHMATAGRRALERGDLPAATSLLRRASGLLPEDHPAYLGVLADLNDCLFQAGATDAASVLLDEVVQRARAAGDEGLVSRAELDQVWLMFMTHPMESTVEDLSKAVEAAVARFEERGDDRNLASALELLSTVQWFTGDAAAMLRQSERALSLARRIGDRRVVPSAASTVAEALLVGETPCPQALARLQELVLELDDDRVARAAVAVQLGLLLGMIGRFDEAWEHVARSAEIFADLGQRKWLADASWKSGLIARFEGRLDDARRHLRESYRSFQEQRDGANAPPTACDLAHVLCDLEEYGESMELSEFAKSQAVSHDLESQVGWRCVRARTLAGRGRSDEAERLAREALELVTPTDFLVLHADVLVDLGEILLRAGRPEEGSNAIAGAIERYERKGAVIAQRRAAGMLV